MEQKGIEKVKQAFSLVAIYMLLLGCTVDKDRFTDDSGRTEGDKVAFTLRMPVQTATTRALSDEDENQVDWVDVLIFRSSDSQFVEVVSTDDIDDDDIYNNLKTFWVRLRGETVLDLVVLGNSREILREVFPEDEDMEGLTKEEILAKLVLTYDGRWVDGSGDAARPFPMWGYRDNADVKNDEFTGEANAIRMTRMVVRIDVHVIGSALNDFKLEEVYLYNRYLQGKLAHSTTVGWDDSEHKATEPEMPTNARVITGVAGRIDYVNNPSPITSAGVSSEGVIYTLEAPAGNESALLETTCLVVGGQYDGGKYYYRVDFMETDNQGRSRFIPLVRNHSYEINIQDVLAKGYDTPDEAFRKGMTNMELDIIAWNEAGMGDITFGAQYQLVVSTDSIYFYSNGREQVLNIYTDHPNGWEVEEKTGLDWVSISDLSGNPEETTGVKISASEFNPGGSLEENRHGYFYIRAGGIRKKVVIYQSNLEELYLEVSPSTLIFNQNGLAVKSVTIEVDPETLPVYVSSAGSVTWAEGGFPESGLIGETVYDFQPEANVIGDQLFSTVTFTISDGTGRSTTREVLVIQNRDNANFNITFQHNKYPAAGGNNFYFDVYSEYVWEIDEANISPAGVLTPVTTGEQPAGTTRYYFNLEENPLYANQTISLPVISSDINFDPFVIPLIQDYDKPWLTIGTPSSRTINFGVVLDGEADAKKRSVTFSLNADWNFSTSGSYTRVVASADHVVTQDYVGGVPNHPETQTVVFTPFVFQPTVGTPVEKTVMTGTAIFTTQNHFPAASASQTVTFNTTVPTFFDESRIVVRKTNSSVGEVIQEGEVMQRTAHTVYTEIPSNTLWATRSSLGGQKLHAATAWDAHRESLSIPVNTEWEEDADGPRDVTIYYTYDNEEKEILTYKQHGYWVKIILDDEILSGTISGKSLRAYNYIIEGDFPNESIRIRQVSPNGTSDYTVNSSMSPPLTANINPIRNNSGELIDDYTIQYTYDGLKNSTDRRWHDLAIVKQRRGNLVLSSGSSVAVEYLGGTGTTIRYTWAEAMGIDLKYNNEPFDGEIDTEGNYIATEPTGCNAYSEGPYGPGEWRLPSQKEVKEIYERIGETGITSRPVLWTYETVEEEPLQAYATRYSLGYIPVPVIKSASMFSYTSGGTTYGATIAIRCVTKEKNLPTDR